MRLRDNDVPTRSHMHRIEPQLEQSLREKIESWQRDGVIVPATSPWASPLVPVAKKDGSTHWAIDDPDSYPTPSLSAVIDSLAGSKIFSSLDAAQAFHNIPIEETSQEAAAFICSFGLFKFAHMPFGLKNAGTVYCRLVAQIMADLGLECCALS